MRRMSRRLVAALVLVAGCGSGGPASSDVTIASPTLTAQQQRILDGVMLRIGSTDTQACLGAESDELDLHVTATCIDLPLAAVELVHVTGVPPGLFDDGYTAISLYISPFAEAVIDVEPSDGHIDPIFKGVDGALLILGEGFDNLRPVTLLVAHGERILRCRLAASMNNCE
jgi:hypothetical protein